MTDQPALRIENLKFRYHKRRRGEPWVIDIGALTLARGEQVLLTGGSGRGKSTLLHLIAGLMEPVDGETYVDGTPIHSLRGAQRDLFRGKRIGMIFQSFNLLHGFSALDNVLAALMFSSMPRKEHKRRALYLLKHLGIDHPRRNPDKMSVGQQQRVAVARAMACDPVLVLADEPTASLDPDNALNAIELIQSICREKNAALLCVSHDPALRERFARQASLDDLARGLAPQRPAIPMAAAAPPVEARQKAAGSDVEPVDHEEAEDDVELDLEGEVVRRDPLGELGDVDDDDDADDVNLKEQDEPLSR